MKIWYPNGWFLMNMKRQWRTTEAGKRHAKKCRKTDRNIDIFGTVIIEFLVWEGLAVQKDYLSNEDIRWWSGSCGREFNGSLDRTSGRIQSCDASARLTYDEATKPNGERWKLYVVWSIKYMPEGWLQWQAQLNIVNEENDLNLGGDLEPRQSTTLLS